MKALLIVVSCTIGPPAHCVVIEAPASIHDCLWHKAQLAREATPAGYEPSEWRCRRVR